MNPVMNPITQGASFSPLYWQTAKDYMYWPTHENATAKSPKSYLQAAHSARCASWNLADFFPCFSDSPTKQQAETRTKHHCTLVSGGLSGCFFPWWFVLFVAEGIPNKPGNEEHPKSCHFLCVCSMMSLKKKKRKKKKPSGCKYPTLHTLQSPLGQMCQAHVGGRTEQHISYGPKTWSTNIFYIIIIQNEWKFLPPSSSPKNIAHYEHRAMLPTLQEHKYHLSLFVLCSSWKVEKWLRDKWFLKSPQGL